MPAIQAMRSDALAMRAKEDVQEKIPSFFNSVNQALGQNIVAGQDSAEQLVTARFQAANALAAQIRSKVDGQGALADMAAGAGMKLISSALDTVLAILGKTTTTDAIEVASDIANFLLERETLQLQWDAVAATHAQWTVQAGYTGHGAYFTPDPVGGSANYTISVNQWLELDATGAPASGSLAGSGGRLSQLEGNWTTTSYTGKTQNTPTDMVLYKYQPRNWQNKPSVNYNLYDDDGLAETPDVPVPGNPTDPILSTAGLTINKNGNGKWGDAGDDGSQVYYSATTNKFYVQYKFDVVQSYTVAATDVNLSINIPTHTMSVANGASGFDFEVHTTATQDDYNSTGNSSFQTNYATAVDYNGDLLFDFNNDGVVNALDAQSDNDHDGTVGNGQYINVGPTDGADNDNDGVVDNAGEIALQYQSGVDIDDLLPQSSSMLTSVRANQPSAGGTAYTENVTIPGQTLYPYSLGGRGALKYRDAYTPRYTDRGSYANSTAGWGAGQGYDYYYNWGSVGSITRVGQYP